MAKKSNTKMIVGLVLITGAVLGLYFYVGKRKPTIPPSLAETIPDSAAKDASNYNNTRLAQGGWKPVQDWGNFGVGVRYVREVFGIGEDKGFYNENHRAILAWLKGHDLAPSAATIGKHKDEIAAWLNAGNKPDPDAVIKGEYL